MTLLSLSIVNLLALIVNLTLVTPRTLPSAARAQVCTNAPLTVAGTYVTPHPFPNDPHDPRCKPDKAHCSLFDRGASPHGRTLAPNALIPRERSDTILWCAPGTETYVTVVLTITAAARLTAARAIEDALTMAAVQINAVINLHGDGIIPSGRYEYDFAGGAKFRTWNANNHQQTYGVVGAAISALVDFMSRYEYCAVDFEIWDGGNQVGVGQLSND